LLGDPLLKKQGLMALGSLSASLMAVVAVVAAVMAAATIWLLLTDPVSVAGALNQGTVTPLVSQLAQVIATAFRDLLAWL
jgi:hypothetical protein